MTEITEPTPPTIEEPGNPEPGSPPASPEWMADLPDDLKADETLSRYADKEAVARGLLENKKLARSKLALPGEGATDDEWGAFYNAIGRPESPEGYDIKTVPLPVDATPEQRAAVQEATKPYRELAHRIGLTNTQADALAEFDQQRAADFVAKGQDEVDALKAELGKDYEPKRAAAQRAFTQVFGDDEEGVRLAGEMDQKVGSARLVKGMMRLAELMGEHRIIETDDVPGFGAVENAEAKLAELNNDKTWRDKRNAGDAQAIAQEKRLLELATRQALRRGG